ncbi:MAG TPA: DUF4139 domain-containing protein [Dissulfurispiraceae bacterium]|nr:DUF4139 domain-containing protein [Dissulfurispiraceae bacterium]
MRYLSGCMLASCLILIFHISASFADERDTRPALSSTSKEQTSVSLTVYNVNLGLVKDQRVLKLPEGLTEVRFMDVAAQIIPTSVYIRSLGRLGMMQVLEQNYEYDLLNPQKLMDKYVGKEVKLFYRNPYTDKEEVVNATLLSNNNGAIYKIGNEITFGHPGRVVFPSVPDNLMSRPTLVWLLKSAGVENKVEASYLTNGINWRADYVLTLNEGDDRADIAGWVTIDNKSGSSYKDARLKLIAGDVHRVKEEADYRDKMVRAAKAEAMPSEPQFRQEEFFEYHIYTLQRPSTIRDNQTKQISLVDASNVAVRKELVFKGANYYYFSQYGDQMPKQKVGVFVEFQNKKDNNLGIPLPKGIVRVYKRDGEGGLQFVGEDSIDHTPKDEKVRIMLGEAFDVVGTRKQTDWKKVSKNIYEASFEILLRNHKKEGITVKVLEPIPGDWTILGSSHEYKKTEAFMAEFSVTVPADQEAKLNYTVRMKY